jgi:hypothetical protein
LAGKNLFPMGGGTMARGAWHPGTFPAQRTKTMTVQTEFATKTFDQVFDCFRKATESTLQVQQDLFRQWTSSWPGFPKVLPVPEQCQQFPKQWTQATAELTRKYMEIWDRQYKAGVEALEGAFKLGEAKDPVELRQKVMDLWQKSFACLKELAETQARNFQTAIEKWMEVAKKTSP